MKRVLISAIFFCLLCASTESFAQGGWVLRESGTRKQLRSISSFDGQNVVAVGANGTVVNSDSAGISWKVQASLHWPNIFYPLPDLDTNLNGVCAIASKVFCTVGPKDSIYRTTDGGISWSVFKSRAKGNCATLWKLDDIYPPEYFKLTEIIALDFDKVTGLCVAIGHGGEVIFSADSGKHWTQNLPNTLEQLNCISFFNDTTLVGADSGDYFFTADKGEDWKNGWVQKNITLFGSDVHGWTFVGDGGSIFHSTNFGLHWDPIPSTTKANLNAVHFADNTHGYIAGDGGIILMTTDGGYTWQQQQSPTTKNLRSVHFTDPFHGFICGDSGVILTTTNGGYTNAVHPVPSGDLYSVRSYPNPTLSRTSIEISIPNRAHIRLRIYNLLGEEIATLADGIYDGGQRNFEWISDGIASGVYVCKMEVDGRSIISQIIVTK